MYNGKMWNKNYEFSYQQLRCNKPSFELVAEVGNAWTRTRSMTKKLEKRLIPVNKPRQFTLHTEHEDKCSFNRFLAHTVGIRMTFRMPTARVTFLQSTMVGVSYAEFYIGDEVIKDIEYTLSLSVLINNNWN